jgi:hypothetical protein
MKGKGANIISVESKEESIISFSINLALNLAADNVVDCNTPNSSV